MWTSTLENLYSGFANNKSVDQPAHPRSLISAFVVRFSQSTGQTTVPRGKVTVKHLFALLAIYECSCIIEFIKGDGNPDDNLDLYERS